MESSKIGEYERRAARLSRISGDICFCLGAVFAVLGIISEAINITFGLVPTSWYLLSIASFAASIGWYICLAIGVLYKGE